MGFPQAELGAQYLEGNSTYLYPVRNLNALRRCFSNHTFGFWLSPSITEFRYLVSSPNRHCEVRFQLALSRGISLSKLLRETAFVTRPSSSGETLEKRNEKPGPLRLMVWAIRSREEIAANSI